MGYLRPLAVRFGLSLLELSSVYTVMGHAGIDGVLRMDAKTSDITSKKGRRSVSLQVINTCALVVAIVLSIVAAATATRIMFEHTALEEAHQNYESCANATAELTGASDHLTSCARMYVITGQQEYLDKYIREYAQTRTREESLETLRKLVTSDAAYLELSEAYESSTKLGGHELYAMRLAAEATHLDPMPAELESIRLGNDAMLTDAQKLARAEQIVLGKDYESTKRSIQENADSCTKELLSSLEASKQSSEKLLNSLLANFRIIVFALVGIILFTVVLNYLLVVRPLKIHAERIRQNMPLDSLGAIELRNMVDSYNIMYAENRHKEAMLKREAETDPLTGLMNRGFYNRLLESGEEHLALLLIDVDLFKNINDNYGHEVGDLVLRKVAFSLVNHFRTSDYACRIGGDEFAVVMTAMEGVRHHIITQKISDISADLQNTSDNLPQITLSVGIAYSDDVHGDLSLYNAADKALYQSKEGGRNRYTFYTPES